MRKRSSSPSLSETADGSSYGDSRLVTSLARGMGILRVFGDGTNALGNQDIATRTGLPKPTVSRLTYTLTALGYLSYSQETGRYQLGTGVLSLGYACLAGMGIQKMSRSLMQGLAEYSGVSVALGGRDHLDMIYLECRKGNSAVHLALDTGSRIDLATSALGRAYFVGVSETEQESLKRDIAEKNPGTWKTIHAGLEKAQRDYKQYGFTISLGDWTKEVHGVGVPFFPNINGDILALNCGGPSYLLKPEKLINDLGPRLIKLARDINAEVNRY